MPDGQGFQPVTGTHPAPAPSTDVNASNERGLAAVSYILTWLTGLIIFLVARKGQKYARWHAIQAIGLGIVAFVLSLLLNVLTLAMGWNMGLGFGFGMGMWSSPLWLLVLVLVIVLAVQAYQGKSIRLPIIADFADKNA